MDIDFSENLQVPVKFDPQSLHWCHPQIIVHAGIVKFNEQKTYHPYLSSDKKYDHVFVKVAIEEMLAEEDIKQGTTVIIESDNYTSQYKSRAHFSDMQELADEMELTIIRVFGMTEHGKGEVDHVTGEVDHVTREVDHVRGIAK